MEDKEAIEAIALQARNWRFGKYKGNDIPFKKESGLVKDECYQFSNQLLKTLTSLGYVKLAEQKLPNKFGLGFPLASWNETEKVQYERGQQDMLLVDSEGCAYRRVSLLAQANPKEPVKEPCPECGGSGNVINPRPPRLSQCKTCNGTGRSK
jgi:hypothetical protein